VKKKYKDFKVNGTYNYHCSLRIKHYGG